MTSLCEKPYKKVIVSTLFLQLPALRCGRATTSQACDASWEPLLSNEQDGQNISGVSRSICRGGPPAQSFDFSFGLTVESDDELVQHGEPERRVKRGAKPSYSCPPRNLLMTILPATISFGISGRQRATPQFQPKLFLRHRTAHLQRRQRGHQPSPGDLSSFRHQILDHESN